MARAPVPGACKTRLAKAMGEERAARFYEAMLLDLLDALRAVPASRHVILATPEYDGVVTVRTLAPKPWEVINQRGADLTERLKAAFEDLGIKQNPVIIVGSDSPTLPVSAIAEAIEQFEDRGQVMLGPALDGGYYLVGMNRPALGIFDGIPWSTSRVYPLTIEKCDSRGLDVIELPPCYDIDEAADLEKLEQELRDDRSRAPRCAQLLGIL